MTDETRRSPAEAVSHSLALHLQELADRCKEIGRSDLTLDAMIHASADLPVAEKPETYTGSIDAAMTLLPAGLQYIEMTLSWDTIGCWPAVSVRWYPPGSTGKGWHGCVSSGATVALALCNAALTIRARQLTAYQRPEGS